jgi:hypothetical protein
MRRTALTAAKVIPDVLAGLNLASGLKLRIQYGDVVVTRAGVRLEESLAVDQPTVMVRMCP